MVVGRFPLSEARVGAVRAFARARAFDLIQLPGMTPGEANRFNVLDGPYFRQAAERLLGAGRDSFVHGYKFDIRPATDDRPYFSSFFRWSHAPEILRLSRQGGIGLLDVGYLALPAALVQAIVASAALILLPLLAIRGRRGRARRWPALAGFFCIGLAFLLIEIAFIGQFTVILSHPVHALVVVLAGFLLFAGAGSYLSARGGARASVTGPIAGIAAIATTCALLSPTLTSALIGAPDVRAVRRHPRAHRAARDADGHAVPPRARTAERRRPAAAPLGPWGINGCASVIAAVLATLLAIHLGHAVVILAGVVLYLAAAIFIGRMAPAGG